MAISVDAHVFATRPVGSNQNVRGAAADDPAAALVALRAAGHRFYMVNELGDEYTPQEWDQLVAENRDDQHYTPNWVSGVEPADQGPCLWIDCKDEDAHLMRDKFVEIIIDELQKHGVTNARIESFAEDGDL